MRSPTRGAYSGGRRFALVAFAALVSGGLSTRAGADEPPGVVIAVDALRDPVAVRLRAELRVLGFAVVVVQAPALAPSRALLEAAVRERGAVAAFRIARSRAGVEVWIFDRFTNKTVLREVIVGGEPDALAHAAIVATRAVELLRASLLELSLPRRGVFDPEVPPEVRALVAPPRRTRPRPRGVALALTAGPGVALSPGGVGPSLHLMIETGLRVTPRWTASVLMALPLAVDTIDAREGRAVIAPLLVGAMVSHRLPTGSSWLHTGVRLGLGAAFVRMEGEVAREGAVGRSVTTASLLTLAGGTVRFLPSSRLHLVAGLDLGVTSPRPVVRFQSRNVASWGVPLVLASVGLEIEGP